MTTAFHSNDVLSIPLNKLVSGKNNVRKTGVTDRIGELKASIAAEGVLQSLVVKKAAKGKFAVIAGQRRLLALEALAEEGVIAEDYPVPCGLRNGESDPTEIGLAENVVRAPMHPADQFEAFRDLMDDAGLTPADIAARFGISETAVKQRLKLARVSKKVFKAYREGQLTLEQVQAFTVSDDHKAQDAVLKGGYLNPGHIRNALTESKIRATDKRTRFVTVAAYEAAGGAVTRDLFAEGDEGVYLLDAELLDRLALEKLKSEAEKVKAEGWKWVEAFPQVDHSEMDYRVRKPEPLPLSAELEDERRQLTEEYEALNASEEDLDEEASDRLDAIEQRIEEIESSVGKAYTPDVMAIGGAIVTIGHNGELAVLRGLVRPEDETEEEDVESKPKKERPEFSSKLVGSLTAARSAAIGATLSENPSVALASVVHGLAMSVFDGYSGDGRLELSGDVTEYDDDSRGAIELKLSYEKWADRLPGEEAALFDWCLGQEQSTLLDLLAFCAGCTVNAVRKKLDKSHSPRAAHADTLAAALKLDMKEWFTPTAENFFKRVGRTTIVNALTEAKGIPAKRSWQKQKKSELAVLAEREIAGTGWLPSVLKA